MIGALFILDDPLVGLDFKLRERLIEDLSQVSQGPDGGKHKKRETDPTTKVSYEKHGHTSDAGEYLLCSAFSDQFELHK